ncbi:hypothetical protein EAE99_009299 [Botrytis elliptica]|nr:hypothetical protein EAE99_009299 [Botrytis elliptica]
MCFKSFWGYTCGHCSLPCITKCPTTAQNENFPPCSIPALQTIPANQFCHACMRVSWNMSVIAEENAHRERHERGECKCEVIFDRAERERRERERGGDLGARDFRREGEGNGNGNERDGNGRARAGGRGRGRDTGANTAGTIDNAGDNNHGGREGQGRQPEEIGGNSVMMQGSNMEAMMNTTPPGYRSPHPRDPASSHRYFHVANVHRRGPYDMNPVTGVVPARPIENPPIRASSSPMYGDMMIISPDPRMSNMGVYPPGHPILANHRAEAHAFHSFEMPPPPSSGPPSYRSPNFAPSTYSDGNGSTIYPGNQYSWSPDPEPTAPMPMHGSERGPIGGMDPRSYGQSGPPSQPRFRHTPTPFTDPTSYPMIYPQNQVMDTDAHRETYNYAGYYMDRPHFNASTSANTNARGSPQTRAQGPAGVSMAEHQPLGGFARAPTFSPLSRGVSSPRNVWHASDNGLPPLPPQVPYLGDLPLVAPAAPRHFNEGHHGARRNGRHGNGNAQRNTVQRARTTQSMGQLQMQMTTTTGPVQTDSQSTQATTQANTIQGQAQMHSQDTPATMNIALLRTPRVISSMPRPNSTM